MVDPTVTAVQKQLAQLGYYSGPIDGIYGPLVRDAVAKYQIAMHQDVTGSLSPETLRSFGLSQPVASRIPTSDCDETTACSSLPARAPSPTRMALVFASTSCCRPRCSLNANSEPDQLLISAERNRESEV